MRAISVSLSPYDGLHGDRGLHARRLLARGNLEQAVRVDVEGDANARGSRNHGRNATELEARKRTAIGNALALALHDVNRHRGLASPCTS
jgi:hypothetical protein